MGEPSETFFVDVIGFGEAVDIMPLVHEAISRCPFKHDFSPREVAELTAKAVSGKYIPVDVLDRIEDQMLGALTGVVISWVQSEHRIEQVRDPDLRISRPYIELSTFDEQPQCEAARRLFGRWLAPDELKRFPLDQCDSWSCDCSYTTYSLRDVERKCPEPLEFLGRH